MPQPRRTTSRRTTAKRTTARRTTARKTTARPSTKSSQDKAIERFNKSLDAAQKALKDVRSTAGTGAKDLYSTFNKSLTQARRDSGKLAKNLQRDIQKGAKRTASAARGRPTATRRAASGRAATRRSTSGRSTARRATSGRSTARRSTSGRSSSRRSR
jgi:hypothetical protein